MKVLGAILCGGQSSRFGSDKGSFVVEGRTLLDQVLARLAPQVDAIVCCGRTVAGVVSLDDRPVAGLGPLGGLNAALHDAATRGYDAVLSVPCDAPDLPGDLVIRLMASAPTYAEALPVVGLWPASLADRLDAFVRSDRRRSMRGWAEISGATPAMLGERIVNLNTPEDLAAWLSRGKPPAVPPS